MNTMINYVCFNFLLLYVGQQLYPLHTSHVLLSNCSPTGKSHVFVTFHFFKNFESFQQVVTFKASSNVVVIERRQQQQQQHRYPCTLYSSIVSIISINIIYNSPIESVIVSLISLLAFFKRYPHHRSCSALSTKALLHLNLPLENPRPTHYSLSSSPSACSSFP
jgi:hypothetical protein